MNKRMLTAAPGSWKWSRRVAPLLAGGLAPTLGWAQQAAPRTVLGRITFNDGTGLPVPKGGG